MLIDCEVTTAANLFCLEQCQRGILEKGKLSKFRVSEDRLLEPQKEY